MEEGTMHSEVDKSCKRKGDWAWLLKIDRAM